LLVADENLTDADLKMLAAGSRVMTNRIDIARRLASLPLVSQFGDFDFNAIAADSLDSVCYPVSKEKAVVHHIANLCFHCLKTGGELVLAGARQTGIRTYARTIGDYFGARAIAEKHRDCYRVVIAKPGPVANTPLEDSDYDNLRPIFNLDDLPVLSKPGLFGWNKLDQGSQLLAAHLPDFFSGFERMPETALDLGCGYGYLSLMAVRGGIEQVTATDNCAAAIIACRANFDGHGVDGRVIADDCGGEIESKFDCLLCNPPFHQGFSRDYRLTDRFLANARRLLRPGGRALFVVNQFVPLEKRASAFFRSVATVVSDGSFKLVELA